MHVIFVDEDTDIEAAVFASTQQQWEVFGLPDTAATPNVGAATVLPLPIEESK